MVRKILNRQLWILVPLFGLLGLQIQLNTYLRMNAPVSIELPSELSVDRKNADPKLFKILSLGHLPITVDWLWLLCLVDPTVTPVAAGSHPPLFYNFDLLTRLDNAFFTAYYASANLLAVIRRDGAGALHLLERAEEFRTKTLPTYPESFRERYWPNQWKIPLLSAYVQLFELQNLPAAADSFILASQIPGAPPYLSSLAERFRKRNGEFEVGLRLLKFMISNAPNETSKAELVKKHEALELSYFLRELNDKFTADLRNRKLPASAASQHWPRFREQQGITGQDPLGGDLFIDENGMIDSTTPRMTVFGMGHTD
ncbi:MAG TPA: hypothetical protein DCS07_02920 [Bdellovibrionales bacterium]|nr:MAG: hypothetical protein A2Z97_11130 [Bdellovibrionales bacterium GWB1_52_6]OFZ02544.1 MAG: hypothetical protein A2X97_07750 [Bdellovibrionales bacterium GWA1_52_35]HAR41575.1 hypothetical protein [Bdellovibrionales bacterium]HCM41393.1 hypothetical protein [Bdellovibrionales bacterium]